MSGRPQATPVNGATLCAALRAAKAAGVGPEAKRPDGKTATKWYANVVRYDDSGREAANCVWWNREVYVDGKWSRPSKLQYFGMTMSGSIGPITDDEVARIAGEFKNAKFKVEKRDKDRDPQIGVKRWAKVETEDDGVTLKKGADGKPLQPPESEANVLYETMALLNETFMIEFQDRIARGLILDTNSFQERAGAGEDMSKARAVPSTKLIQGVQTMFAPTSKLKGKMMPNPMWRGKIPVDRTSGAFKSTQIFDKTRLVEKRDAAGAVLVGPDGKAQMTYAPAAVDYPEKGTPLSNVNAHRFLRSGCKFDATVDASSACASNLGISASAKFDILVVTPVAEAARSSLDDLFGATPAAPGGPPTAVVAEVPVAAPSLEEAYEPDDAALDAAVAGLGLEG